MADAATPQASALEQPRFWTLDRVADAFGGGPRGSHALALAGPEDLVLLAGKGHETYQVRGTTRLPFDERQIVNEILTERVS